MSSDDLFDADLDNPYRAPEAAPPTAPGAGRGWYQEYGGFLPRVAAAIIDLIVMRVVGNAAGLAVGLLLVAADVDPGGPAPQAMLALLGIALNLGYYAGMESSHRQATVGKLALGLKVTDLEGRRISLGRAVGRQLGEILSALTLGLGFLMILWDRRKQGLHDKLAGTLVIRSRWGGAPDWAGWPN